MAFKTLSLILHAQLKRQYRCHPAIGSLASSLFYGGKLINGVSPEQRSPIIKGFSPIIFFDVASGIETANDAGSFANKEVNWRISFFTWLVVSNFCSNIVFLGSKICEIYCFWNLGCWRAGISGLDT
jgi:hypothetical protein